MNSTLRTLRDEGRCFLNEPLAKHTTFGVGGPATIFVLPKTIEQLVEIVEFCENSFMKHIVIGNGSNLLFSDTGYKGVVICTKKMDQTIAVRNNTITVSSGVPIAKLAQTAMNNGLSGLESLTGIPGTIGGAIVQNAGAFGREIGESITRVLCYENHKLKALPSTECEFSYRFSRFKKQKSLILDACFALSKEPTENIKNKMKMYAARRIASQPTGRSAGSVFKSRGGFAAGYLIEQAGLKGKIVGGAQISEKHANFIVNNGGATAKDILKLIDETREKVHNIFGVLLETEIEILDRE